MAAGGVALFGLPGAVQPMQLLIDPVEYVNHGSDLYRDTKYVQRTLPGLSITEIWLQGTKAGTMSEPKALSGLAAFQAALEKDPDVGAVVGPITMLEVLRYGGGQGGTFPTDTDGVEQAAADLEGLMQREPLLHRFVQPDRLAHAHVAVVTRVTEHEAFQRLAARIRERWAETGGKVPELAGVEIKTVGLGPLQAKMSQ